MSNTFSVGDRVRWAGEPANWWNSGPGTVVRTNAKLAGVHWDKDKKFPPETAGNYFAADLAPAA